MKKHVAFLLGGFMLFALNSNIRAQSLEITAFDTNGPIGAVLFPQDSLGNITLTGIAELPYSADTIASLVQDYLYLVGKVNETDIKDIYKGLSVVGCDITLEVGKRLFSIPYAGTFVRPMSKISFSVVAEVRNGKFRYTLNNFHLKRWRIKGEGKDQGKPNILHWQRVNSIKKEINNKDFDVENMLKAEEYIYKAEYDAVMAFIDGLKKLNTLQEPF